MEQYMPTAQWWLITLRLLHILAGVFWTGGAFMLARFVVPTFVSNAAGLMLLRDLTQRRRVPVVINVAALVSIVSGTLLFWTMGHTAGEVWEGSPTGLTLSVGGALALLAAIVGNVVTRPAGKRLARYGELLSTNDGSSLGEHADTVRHLHKRMQRGMNATATLLVLAAACMAVARYI